MDIQSSIGLLSYALSFLLFSLVSIALFFSSSSINHNARLKCALLSSSLWCAAINISYIYSNFSLLFIHLTELIRNLSWLYFLLGLATPEKTSSLGRFSQSKLYLIATGAILASTSLVPLLMTSVNAETYRFIFELPLISKIISAVLALLLIEQIYRNSDRVRRWALKHLCLGVGLFYAYDFYLFADAALFKQLDSNLWHVRGAINAIAVPLIALSVTRIPSWQFKLQVSRKIVFHTATLSGAGAYLVAMAAAGYFIKFYGGSWGTIIQMIFMIGAGLLLFVLFFSDKIRSNIRVLINKHFFSYKYDYREEWLKFTALLSDTKNDIPERICIAFATITKSPGCLLWSRVDEEKYEKIADFHMPETVILQRIDSLIRFFEETQWILDIDEYKNKPDKYQNLTLPNSLLESPHAWLLLPLLFNDKLCGILLIKRSSFITVINWEDRDLLKISAKQAATLLAQHQASQALVAGRQFEAFNRLSAYIVHDLKNILAQQSLIVTNAEKHKSNPAFIEDVIKTIKNSVQRMTKLMEQMRNGMRGKAPKKIEVNALCLQAIDRFSVSLPKPIAMLSTDDMYVFADSDQLLNVLCHLLQNAVDATPSHKNITLKTSHSDTEAIIELIDTGKGMDEAFIRNRLFKPFDSTKGLTGMGIGAYESREVIRALGGEISVSSKIAEGTHFTVRLPLIME